MDQNRDDFQLIDIREASEYLHIPVNTLYKIYSSLPHLKIGHRILFCKLRLNEWLEEQVRNNRN